MFNICEYIKSNETLKDMDLLIVYRTIVELCKDKKMVMNGNV